LGSRKRAADQEQI